ncbi:uncharacterized protein LOC128388572 [Panonychus citri]|uniref:uncharacterized protein LOC128388572 n=1 Tax=Panonychus citri TaxID=50023 RepID=UPI002306E5A5|nr:uncharacterized protein LOC128388572 [Panonychus citri]
MSSRNTPTMETISIGVPISPCDTISYAYLCLALTLFAAGSLITLLSIEESHSLTSAFARFWFIGPFFLCCGLMVALKTLIHIRKKTLIDYLTRQTILAALNPETDGPYYGPSDLEIGNNYTNQPSPPPSYETAIANGFNHPEKIYL